MSKRTHEKELERARARRRGAVLERRQRRVRMIALLAITGLLVSVFALAVLSRDDGSPVVEDAPDDPDAQSAEGAAADAPCPPPGDDLPAPREEPYDDPPRFDLDADEPHRVVLSTTCGDIEIEVDTAGAPRTAENFLALADDGYYDGTPFHRVQPDFVAQGGDPAGTGTGCIDADCEIRMPGYQLPDELDTAADLPESEEAPGAVEYPRGTVAMANSGPDTQGGQFFIVQRDPGYPFEPNYTIIGQVVSGMEVVDDIVAGPVQGDLAVEPVIILDAEVVTP